MGYNKSVFNSEMMIMRNNLNIYKAEREKQ